MQSYELRMSSTGREMRGLQSARAAGCATLAVVTTTARELLDADAVVADLSEVRFEAGPDGIRVRPA